MTVRLHVNVDHVATLRQARGTAYPDPVLAAALCEKAGAHGITVHLREDRRHIQERDVETLRRTVKTLLNLEMAATDAMVAIALRVKPDLVTLVPEKREEQTTEGGLDVVGNAAQVRAVIERLQGAGISVSLFIDPDAAQVRASHEVGARVIELHTGDYANADFTPPTPTPSRGGNEGRREKEVQRLVEAARVAATLELRVAAGHGLTSENVSGLLRAVPQIEELNVGHAIVCDALMVGMEQAVRDFLEAMTR